MLSRNCVDQVEVRWHGGNRFATLNRPLVDRSQLIVGPLRTGRIDGGKIAAHPEDPGLFRIAHDWPIALHPDNAIDDRKMGFNVTLMSKIDFSIPTWCSTFFGQP